MRCTSGLKLLASTSPPALSSQLLSTAPSSTPSWLATSRVGLDPATNRFHAPIVYHEAYSFADWPTNHTFPMDKFEQLRLAVLAKSPHLPRPLVRRESDLFRALDAVKLPREWLAEPTGPIESDFLDRFIGAELQKKRSDT